MSDENQNPSRRAGVDRLHLTQALTNREEARQAYAEWAQTYDEDVEHDLGYASPGLVAEALARHLAPSTARLLDVGCGTGLAGEAVRSFGSWRLYGLDLSVEMLARARAKGVYEGLIAADLGQALPLGDDGFAGAVSSGTFAPGHVGPEAIGQVLRVLDADAPFAFTVHQKIWEDGGFRATLRKLEVEGAMRLAEAETHQHISNVPGQTCIFCVVLKGE